MKTLRFFACLAALMTACALVSASETSDNFANWVPNFAASNLDQRKDAQQNWQNFCRQKGNNPDVQKEIIRVSTEQLAKDNPVDTTVWIVRQLGIVGDAAAVPALAKLLTSGEVRIRDEAARALANIPGKEAEDALKAVNVIAAAQLAKDALTSRTIKGNIPANNPVETQPLQAIPYAPTVDDAKINTLMAGYGSLSNMEKAQVLSNITARAARAQVARQQRRPVEAGDMVLRSLYMVFALEAATSDDETLRNAGILAVGALGNETEVPFLLEQARTGANAELAKVALSRMSGQKIDDVLTEAAKTESDPGKLAILADILNRRFNSGMRTELLAKASAADTPNRLELLQSAEPMSSKADVPAFVKAWALITDRGQKDRAEQIIARLSGQTGQTGGDASAALEAMGNNWDTPEGLSLLGRIGDNGTLEKIRTSKNAVHAFRNWPNAGPNTSVADNLLAIARGADNSADDRLAALRAFIRVISLPTAGNQGNRRQGQGLTDVQKVERLAQAYELASRVEEKRYIIERVGTIRTVESLRFVMKYIDDPELQERACWAVLELAHQTFLKRSALAEFNAALDKVLAVTDNNDYRNRANGYKAAQ